MIRQRSPGLVTVAALGLVTALAAPAGADEASPWFEDASDYKVGTLGQGFGSQTVVSADFDGDGNADTAATDFLGAVSIFRGDGTGKLKRTQYVKTGAGASAVAVGDLTGDGRPDLAVTNLVAFNTSLLFNDGKGGFTVAKTVKAANLPFGAVIADFNNDGKQDLVENGVLPLPKGGLSIMLGKGGGELAEPRPFGWGVAKTTIMAGDVDHDGDQDVVAGDFGTSAARVYLGDGRGGFTEKSNNIVPGPSEDMKLADADGDGNLDIVTANVVTFSFGVRYGRGDSTFTDPVTYGALIGPCAVAVGDFDRDGRPDVAAVQFIPAQAQIFKGLPGRTFTKVSQHEVGLGGQSALAADLNGDRRPELLTQSAISQDLAVLMNRTGR